MRKSLEKLGRRAEAIDAGVKVIELAPDTDGGRAKAAQSQRALEDLLR